MIAEQIKFHYLEYKDLDVVMTVDEEAFLEPWSKTLWEKELSRPDRIYLGAFYEHRLIGFGGGLIIEKDFHITTIATLNRFRDQGVATLLLRALIKSLIDQSETITGITLEVRASNHSAQALYRKFGFAPVGIRRGYYQSDGEDAIIMWLRELSEKTFETKLNEIESSVFAKVQIEGIPT